LDHAFGSSSPFSVGIEEELFLVDASTRRLAPVAREVLGAIGRSEREASHEVYAASVELRSPPSASVAAAREEIEGLRAAVGAVGGTLLGAGLHPAGEFGDVPLVDTERYRRVGESMRGLMRRTPEAALHVHVGLPDGETAIRAFNGLRRHLPLLQALAANSPIWFGFDSGLASARFPHVRSYPRRGVPRAFRDLDEYAQLVARTAAAGEIEDYTYIWWDVRLQPRLGTVEVREMDAQSRIEDVAALAALVQSLARLESESGERGADEPAEAIGESSFRACRDGIAATILHDGAMRPVPEVARLTVGDAAPHARELGCEAELEWIDRILQEGGGAGRQRAAFARGGIEAVLEELVDETMGR
jgi:glutamate---cysteine ligase / carboxylate-amine ligase